MLEWKATLACNSPETKSFCGDYSCESLRTKEKPPRNSAVAFLKQNFLSCLGGGAQTTEPKKANQLRKHSRSERAPTSPEPGRRSCRCCQPATPLAHRCFALLAQ